MTGRPFPNAPNACYPRQLAWEASLMAGGQDVWGTLTTNTVTNMVTQRANVQTGTNKKGE